MSINYSVNPMGLNLASINQRVLNTILDIVFYVILMFIFLVFLVLLSLLDFNIDLDFYFNTIFHLIAYFLYFLIQESIFQRTFAKFCTGTKTVNIHGNRANFQQLLIRTIVRFIPLDWLSFFGNKHQCTGWHDRFSDTLVIKTR
jgi:uncharacterized RDD family membrane protein YckC